MFYDIDTHQGVYSNIKNDNAEVNDTGSQTYTKKEQKEIIKNVKSKIKRLRKQQKEYELMKSKCRDDENKIKQIRRSQYENNMTQREFQKFLKRMSK